MTLPESDPTLVPLSEPEARKLARHIVDFGDVSFTRHAQVEMKNDDLQSTDCLNLLRAGVFSQPEWENNELRYRVSTARMSVVFAFRSRERIRIITAWRER